MSRFSLRELVTNRFQNVFYSHRIIFIEIICIKNEWTRLRNIMDLVSNPLPRLPYCSTLWRTAHTWFFEHATALFEEYCCIII